MFSQKAKDIETHAATNNSKEFITLSMLCSDASCRPFIQKIIIISSSHLRGSPGIIIKREK